MLKVLMLRKKLDAIEAELNQLRSVDFEKREAELMGDIEAAQTDEEREAVSEAVDAFDAERKENEEAVAAKEAEAESVRAEIKELEERNSAAMAAPAAPKEERSMPGAIETRAAELVKRDNVKEFLTQVRTALKTRSITGGNVLVPEEMLPLIRERVEREAKMLRVVNVQTLQGTGRQTIAGTIPEAVWTEACGNINELTLQFLETTIDGYKVAGFVPVCNSLIEASDIDLFEYVQEALAISIAKAIDAAILYGTGVNMPTGIVTRLAQIAAPAGYTGLPWEDLHETHVVKLTPDADDQLTYLRQIYLMLALCANDYAEGSAFFAMSRATAYKLRAEAVNINSGDVALGDIANLLDNIIETNIVPNDNIVIGFGNGYVYGQRNGIQLDVSEHAQFIQDNTVFRAKALGDGRPVVAGSFAVVGLNVDPTTTRTFPSDTANA